jgi:hypothetical protein
MARNTTSTVAAKPVPGDGRAPLGEAMMERVVRVEGTAVLLNGELVDADTGVAGGVITVTVAGVSSSLSTPADPSGDLRVDTGGVLLVRRGEAILASARGMEPSTVADVWLYPSTVRLGDAVTDSAGDFVVQSEMPEDASTGDHRLVVAGTTETGDDIAIAFAVRVAGPSTLARIASSPLVWILIILMVLAALLLPSRVRRAVM